MSDLGKLYLTLFGIVVVVSMAAMTIAKIEDKPIERTCPKQSSDGLILAYATYEGSKLTCTYVPHTRGLVKYVKEES